MTDGPADDLATDEQMNEMRSLAPDEDFPEGMRAAEADQRLVELRAQGH